MKFFARLFSAVFMLATASADAWAQPMSPTGLWESTDGNTHYAVSLCGDGTQLCAYLIWISPRVINRNNRRFLNTSIFRFLEATGPNSWEGEIVVDGRAVQGKVRQIGADQLEVTGCVMVVLCTTGIMPRIGS
jgi:uncharacterized protein (DUF2147 family)